MAVAARAAPGVLGAKDMALLRRLQLDHRRRARGLYPGQRRSPRTARSAELADFRPYATGDDIRQIDWRAYGRLDRLMIRLYVAEEESALNVVVDASESMALGSPAKWPAARRLAAAMAMLGIAALDRVAVGTLSPSGRSTAHVRGGSGSRQLLGFVADLSPGGPASPDDLAGLRWLRPGVTVVISDFLVEGRWAPSLAALGSKGQEVLLWQVLSPDEEDPTLRGDLRLRESESGQHREMTITPRVIHDYRRALAAHRAELTRQAGAAGGRFLHTRSDDHLETCMRTAIGAGVVRRS